MFGALKAAISNVSGMIGTCKKDPPKLRGTLFWGPYIKDPTI